MLIIFQEQVLPEYFFWNSGWSCLKKCKVSENPMTNEQKYFQRFVCNNWLYKMLEAKCLQLWATKIILWPNSFRKSIKSRRTFIVCLCSFSTPWWVIWLEWKSKLVPVTASASSDTGSLGVANSLNTNSRYMGNRTSPCCKI